MYICSYGNIERRLNDKYILLFTFMRGKFIDTCKQSNLYKNMLWKIFSRHLKNLLLLKKFKIKINIYF